MKLIAAVLLASLSAGTSAAWEARVASPDRRLPVVTLHTRYSDRAFPSFVIFDAAVIAGDEPFDGFIGIAYTGVPAGSFEGQSPDDVRVSLRPHAAVTVHLPWHPGARLDASHHPFVEWRNARGTILTRVDAGTISVAPVIFRLRAQNETLDPNLYRGDAAIVEITPDDLPSEIGESSFSSALMISTAAWPELPLRIRAAIFRAVGARCPVMFIGPPTRWPLDPMLRDLLPITVTSAPGVVHLDRFITREGTLNVPYAWTPRPFATWTGERFCSPAVWGMNIFMAEDPGPTKALLRLPPFESAALKGPRIGPAFDWSTLSRELPQFAIVFATLAALLSCAAFIILRWKSHHAVFALVLVASSTIVLECFWRPRVAPAQYVFSDVYEVMAHDGSPLETVEREITTFGPPGQRVCDSEAEITGGLTYALRPFIDVTDAPRARFNGPFALISCSDSATIPSHGMIAARAEGHHLRIDYDLDFKPDEVSAYWEHGTHGHFSMQALHDAHGSVLLQQGLRIAPSGSRFENQFSTYDAVVRYTGHARVAVEFRRRRNGRMTHALFATSLPEASHATYGAEALAEPLGSRTSFLFPPLPEDPSPSKVRLLYVRLDVNSIDWKKSTEPVTLETSTSPPITITIPAASFKDASTLPSEIASDGSGVFATLPLADLRRIAPPHSLVRLTTSSAATAAHLVIRRDPLE